MPGYRRARATFHKHNYTDWYPPPLKGCANPVCNGCSGHRVQANATLSAQDGGRGRHGGEDILGIMNTMLAAMLQTSMILRFENYGRFTKNGTSTPK